MPTKMIHLVGFAGATIVWGCPIGWFWFHNAGLALSCLVTGGVLLAIGAHEMLTSRETPRATDPSMAHASGASDPVLPPLG